MTKINNFRLYGESPFSVVVIHGGLGARGEMAPVAQVLEAEFGVLEPLQAELTLDGQVEELHPAEGVFEPLSARIKSFRFHSIENCGHKPWIERQAKEKFYKVLRSELSGAQA
jgi:hypothetical protein